MQKCPKCGTQNTDSAKFCCECDAKLVGNDEKEPVSSTQAETQEKSTDTIPSQPEPVNNVKTKPHIYPYIFSWALYLVMFASLFFVILGVMYVSQTTRYYYIGGTRYSYNDYGYYEEISSGFKMLSFNSRNFMQPYEAAGTAIGLYCWAMLILSIFFAIKSVINYLKGKPVSKGAHITALSMTCFYGLLGIIVSAVSKGACPSSWTIFTSTFYVIPQTIVCFVLYMIFNKKENTEPAVPVAYRVVENHNTTAVNGIGASATTTTSNQTTMVDENGEKIVFYALKGAQKVLTVYEERLTLTQIKNVRTLITHDLFKGTKEIMFSNIMSVQYKPASNYILGYIQFELPGSGSGNNFGSENSWTFSIDQNETAKKVCAYIKKRIKEMKTPQATIVQNQLSVADELKKLKELLDMGVITQEEFDKKKAELLK